MEWFLWLLLFAVQLIILLLLILLFNKFNKLFKRFSPNFEFDYVVTVQETDKPDKKSYDVKGKPKPVLKGEPKIPPDGED
jgi:hypothetical protein